MHYVEEAKEASDHYLDNNEFEDLINTWCFILFYFSGLSISSFQKDLISFHTNEVLRVKRRRAFASDIRSGIQHRIRTPLER